MPDYDPMLLRATRPIMGGNTQTRGAGLTDNPAILRSLMLNQPRIMGGAKFAKPGIGAIPSLKGAPDSTVQGEFGPDELKSLAAPYTPGMDVVKPDSGATENILRLLRGVTANDPRNIMKDKLEGVKSAQGDEKYKYDMALMKQLWNRKEGAPAPQQGELKLFSPEVSARIPHSEEDALKVSKKLLNSNLAEALLAKNYSTLHKNLQERTQDYHLAKTDMMGWIHKNAVPDTEEALRNLEDLNRAFRNRGEKPMTYPAYKEMLVNQMTENIKRLGVDAVHQHLETNLKTTKDAFENAHKLIDTHKNGE